MSVGFGRPYNSSTMMTPPQTARLAGALYLLMVLFGGLAAMAGRGIVVAGDAATTAANILAHESLYRLAFAAQVLFVVSYVPVVALFHEMLRPVNRSLSLVAAFFGLMGCAILASASLFQLAPLVVLERSQYLSAFTVEQLQAQAFVFLKLFSQTYSISLVFFGFFGVLIGCLIMRSTFLPRFLGLVMALSGLAWLTFLAPAFAVKYFRWILPFATGELLLMLWLAVKGVDAERWNEQAGSVRPTLTPSIPPSRSM
jgi:uncharacterized protein DUF4386